MDGKKKQRPALARPAIAPAVMHVDEAIVYLGTSRSGIYRLFRDGLLSKAVVAGRTVVRRVDADAFLARCVTSAGAKAA